MTTVIEISKYIYDWLVGLDIGDVFQDRKPYDDTTEQRAKRCYITYTFGENGIDDMGPFYQGVCTVTVGCRDKKHFVADMATLAKATKKLYAEFDKNDEVNGAHLLDVEQSEPFSDQMGNHECYFTFDVFVDKLAEETNPSN